MSKYLWTAGMLGVGSLFLLPLFQDDRAGERRTGTWSDAQADVNSGAREDPTPEDPTIAEIIEWIDWSALKGRMKILRKTADEEGREAKLLVEFTRRSGFLIDLWGKYELIGLDEDDLQVLQGCTIEFGPIKNEYEVGERCRASLHIPSWSMLQACEKLVIRKRPGL